VTGTNEGREALLGFLRTDPSDAGCEKTLELLDVYVDLVLADEDPEQRYPGITAHLRACGPCTDDFEGLLSAARAALGTARPDDAFRAITDQ
jgi:hypothetical protein